ncbi:hypothetical protein D6779_09565 [Candidatus Parcubacteria bacterium]|nr:MAG: hypothetical protein D6779_09565 [Candidatus Parcubacteria bacterium]
MSKIRFIFALCLAIGFSIITLFNVKSALTLLLLLYQILVWSIFYNFSVLHKDKKITNPVVTIPFYIILLVMATLPSRIDEFNTNDVSGFSVKSALAIVAWNLIIEKLIHSNDDIPQT